MIVTGPTRQAEVYSQGICQASDSVGDLVRISGPVVGRVYAVTKADPSDATKMPAIGTVIQKFTATTCLIQKTGLLSLSGLPALMTGHLVFVGLDGKPTTTRPFPGASGTGFAIVQAVGIAAATDKVELKVSPVFTKTRL
jgi:hypothetical protein